MKSTSLLLAVAVLFSANLLAQDVSEVEKSSLSKKELRQLHREQRKAEREERHHRHDSDNPEAESGTDAVEQSNATAKQVKQQDEEVEETVEKALLEPNQVDYSSEPTQMAEVSDNDPEENAESSETDEAEESKTEPMDWTWLYVLIATALFFLVVRSRYKKRCTACKSWNIMKVTDRSVVDKEKSTIKKTLKTKNAKGEVIRSKEVVVPATVTHTDVHRKCSKCGHTDILRETKKTEN